MRLAVTVVFPAARQSADVVIDADPATPMTAVAAALDRFARASAARSPAGAPLYVDCQRIWQRLTLAEAPVRDGCVISLGSPDGCVAPEPSGLVSVLVAGGPDAGAIHRVGPGFGDSDGFGEGGVGRLGRVVGARPAGAGAACLAAARTGRHARRRSDDHGRRGLIRMIGGTFRRYLTVGTPDK